MRVADVFNARKTGFIAKHYELFSDGRNLKKLKNRHSGKRCFIIGNGPSLCASDLDTLQRNNEITFAFNRIYHIFDQTSWRPEYYISQDEKMLAGCRGEVERMDAGMKFIPAEMKWYFDIDIKGIQPFHIVNKEKGGMPEFSENIAHEVVNSSTVVYSAVQFAVYMGIVEIYLIGVDHHFHTSINSKGEIIVDPSAKDYFTENYNADKDNLYIPNTDKSTLTYIAAKKYADEHNVMIYNATRGGKLEVFPRTDFDSLFKGSLDIIGRNLR